jgi:hypothetical protein
VWLFRPVNASRRGWVGQIAIHVPAAAIFALAHLALLGGMRHAFQLGAAGWPLYREIFVGDGGRIDGTLRLGAVLFKRVDSDMLIYAMLVGAVAALRYRDQVRPATCRRRGWRRSWPGRS